MKSLIIIFFLSLNFIVISQTNTEQFEMLEQINSFDDIEGFEKNNPNWRVSAGYYHAIDSNLTSAHSLQNIRNTEIGESTLFWGDFDWKMNPIKIIDR